MTLGIVPAQTVGILVKAAAEREVSATFSETHAVFVIGNNLVIRTKLINGTYPNWRQVVPKPSHAETLAVRDLRRALRLCHFGKARKVVFWARKLDGTPLCLSSDLSISTGGEVTTRAKIQARGLLREYAFGLDARYLKDMCGALGGDEITLNTIDPGSAIRIETNNGSVPADIAVLMPMVV